MDWRNKMARNKRRYKVTGYNNTNNYSAHGQQARGPSFENLRAYNRRVRETGTVIEYIDIADACSERCTVQDLPDDVWFLVFRYLSDGALCKLCGVCKCFRRLASADCVWKPRVLESSAFDGMHRGEDSMKERYRVSKNWATESRIEFPMLRYNKHLGKHSLSSLRHRLSLFSCQKLPRMYTMLPWLQREDDKLLVSNGNMIQHFTMKADGYLEENRYAELRGLRTDVTRFVIRNNVVVSGSRNGAVMAWDLSSGRQLLHYRRLHLSDTQCVEVADCCIISASKDKLVKVVSMDPEKENPVKTTLDIEDRAWSLAVSGSTVAVGTSGHLQAPTVLLDINRGEVVSRLEEEGRGSKGWGTLDMKFDTPHTLLTCGHDTYLRLWDIRTGTVVSKWEEKFDNAMYSLVTDGQNCIITGTARHGLARLWDKRKTECMGAYFSGKQNSPVFSLASTSRFMYLAMDRGLTFVDFSWSGAAASKGGLVSYRRW